MKRKPAGYLLVLNILKSSSRERENMKTGRI
jgi:hypothetical protein